MSSSSNSCLHIAVAHSAVTEPQLGVELSEAGDVSSTDIDSKTELSDLGEAVSKPIAPKALESDSDNQALLMGDDADVKFED